MKSFFVALLFWFVSNTYAQQLQLCFKSIDTTSTEKPIQLSFNVIDKEWSSAFVQYKNEEGGVLLKFLSEKTIEATNGKKPVIEYTFSEIINGKANGKYVIAIQENEVLYFYYLKKKSTVRISFEQDYQISKNCGCDW